LKDVIERHKKQIYNLESKNENLEGLIHSNYIENQRFQGDITLNNALIATIRKTIKRFEDRLKDRDK